jgi:DNA end-binding protein Ku
MRVAEGTHDEVPYEDVVKGYEVEDDRWVMLTQEELDSVEPRRSRTIDIEDFVDLDDIDPIYFERTYYLGPEPDPGAERAYRLLLQALEKSGRVGIGRFVMRGKEYLAAIRPMGDVLALETMYFGDEVRDPRKEIENLPEDVEPSQRELDVARQLVDSLTTSWKPSSYRDTYRDQVHQLIERKADGETVEVARDGAQPAPVVDLLAALEASVARRAGRAGERHGVTGGPASADKAARSKASDASTTRTRRSSKAIAGQGVARSKPTSSATRRASDPGHSPSTRRTTKHDEPTRDELVERAKDAGIKGRSKMSKEELAAAVDKAS